MFLGVVMNLNDIYQVTIESLDHQGRGIARIDKMIIFIPGVLPNEIVKIKIVNMKKNYLEGEVVSFIKKSDIRIKPICPYYNECGGCDLMHMPYDEQLKYKEEKVKNIMKRYASLDCVVNIIPCDKPLNYRNKVTFQVKNVIGMYRKKSYDIVPIDKCLLLDEKINECLKKLQTKNLEHIKQIIIRASFDNIMVILESDKDIDIGVHDLDFNVIKKVNNNYINIKGNDYLIDKIGDKKYKISPSSFFQINKNQTKKLYDVVLDYLNLDGSEKVLDLYCGTGTIGIYIANYANEVLGIEINKDAIVDAKSNAKLNNIHNINFMAGDVGNIIKNINFVPNKVIVDPPRSGLDKKTISELFKLLPEKIVYVSCDPITLARDLSELKNKYLVKEITPVDMFCQTYHVECVCLLIKK